MERRTDGGTGQGLLGKARSHIRRCKKACLRFCGCGCGTGCGTGCGIGSLLVTPNVLLYCTSSVQWRLWYLNTLIRVGGVGGAEGRRGRGAEGVV